MYVYLLFDYLSANGVLTAPEFAFVVLLSPLASMRISTQREIYLRASGFFGFVLSLNITLYLYVTEVVRQRRHSSIGVQAPGNCGVSPLW